MKNEKLYIYFYSAQEKEAELLQNQIESFGLELTIVNLDNDKTDIELVNGLIEQSNNPFPILRVGDQKIRAMFQNPKLELLQKLFTDNIVEFTLPKPTLYSTTWCGDCHQLNAWMDSQHIDYKDILIDDSDELQNQVIHWSGGRRVIPTIDYASIGRLFNPGIALFQKLYKQP